MSTTFNIKVQKAVLTYDCCTFSTMDPFFMAYFDVRTNPFRSSVCKNGGKYPSWNENFNLQFNGERCLTIEVFHDNESLGKIEFDVKDCVNNTFEMDIEQPLSKMGKQTGTISFTLKAQGVSGFSGGINFGSGNNLNNVNNQTNNNQINNNSTGFSNFNPNQNNNGNNINNYNPNTAFTPGFNNINNNSNFGNTNNNQLNTGGQQYNNSFGTDHPNLNNFNNQNYDINQAGEFGINNKINVQQDFHSGFNNIIGGNNEGQFTNHGQSVPMMNNFSQPFNSFDAKNQNFSNQNFSNQNFSNQNNSNYPSFNNNQGGFNTNNGNNFNFSNSNQNFGGSGVMSKSLQYFKNPVYFQDSSRKIHRLDLNSGNWENLSNNSQEFFNRYHRAAELPDGSYLITGGEYNNQPTNTCSHFSNGNFARKDKMNVLRKAHSSIYMNGFVYVFGGFSNGGITNTCERYSFNQNNWQNISNMIIPRAYTTPVVYGDTYIFLVGGMINSYNGLFETDSIERFDANQNRFEEMNFRLAFAGYGIISSFISEKQLLIVGGFSERTQMIPKVYTIDITSGYKDDSLPDLEKPTWSVAPAYFFNQSLHIMHKGEDLDDYPYLIKYSLNKV